MVLCQAIFEIFKTAIQDGQQMSMVKVDPELAERNYAQTQFSVTEFRVQGQSSDFQCTRTTHYNAYLPEKGHNNAYSPK